MSSSVPPYRLKIERAKRHIRELAEEIEAFNAREPYEVFTEDDVAAGQRVCRVRVRESIPVEWSAIVGDAIHNARSALDLLMVAVVMHCDPNRLSYKHVHFVIRESREEFEAALPKNIKGASPEARQVIENLKPYKGGNEAFWRLHQLDILDKHKAIIPVGAAHAASGITFDFARHFPEVDWVKDIQFPLVFVRPQDRLFPLQDGAELLRVPLDDKSPLKDEYQFGIHIAFGEGQIIDGEPVVPALAQCCQFVESVCNTVEKLVVKGTA